MSDDARFFSFLKDRIGLDVTSVGEAIIERALRQRAATVDCVDSDAYWQLLVTSPQEQQALIEAVIVPETSFFRYPESFATLGKLARERVANLAGVRPLRILSLPCSTGEEPYSMVMALFDAGVDARQFKVDAIDISPVSIAKAERGIYGKNSFRGSELGFRERYFSPVPEGFEVSERVRACVNFQSGNLLDPNLATQVAYDIVFCRNLVIYFDQQTQQRVFQVLKQLTRQDGLLFIGPAEGNLLAGIGMRSIGIAQSFAFSHAPQDPTVPAPARARPHARRSTSRHEPPRRAPPDEPPPRSRPASNRLWSATMPQRRCSTASRTLPTRATALQRGLRASAICNSMNPSPKSFYWLGLLSEVAGSVAQAQGFYRKALYLQPQHRESLAQLAALLAAQGDTAGARRLQDRAARGTNKQGNH